MGELTLTEARYSIKRADWEWGDGPHSPVIFMMSAFSKEFWDSVGDLRSENLTFTPTLPLSSRLP